MVERFVDIEKATGSIPVSPTQRITNPITIAPDRSPIARQRRLKHMTKQVTEFTQESMKKDLPEINPGDTVRVHQKIKDKDKEKIQIFEGMVIAKKHKKELGATITVRKVSSGVGVEKIFPIHSPVIAKIEVTKTRKVRRAKLYYMRTAKGKRAQLKILEQK